MSHSWLSELLLVSIAPEGRRAGSARALHVVCLARLAIKKIALRISGCTEAAIAVLGVLSTMIIADRQTCFSK